ncbi:sporulation protein [Jeongeupia sp. HS-3]|uniref:SPOR domain-containing protein n=1 Tax=Jeongeupia sp. HS-3 TaxID=1009682 RepID=UPI0018A5C4F9|nr:SPOR domain-containing protein [Jeongeupia sp. HS-3]BCL75432.1 sporulation protein [Jeongeupia sp. HS-3]
MARENISEELLQLRKRARRRLVGAIALVLFSLLVLWTVMDGEPPAALSQGATSVEIIASAPSASTVAAAASAPLALADATSEPMPAPIAMPAQTESTPLIEQDNAALLPGKLVNPQLERHPTPTPAPKPTVKPTPLKEAKPVAEHPVAKPTPAKDPARILEGLDDGNGKADAPRQYYLQLGAYADKAKASEMVAKLKEAGVPAYSETVNTDKGALTRVRVGPADQGKARAWQQKLDALGVSARLVSK